ncbi:MAG: hemerythrin domain-containing protein [Actinomycetes bacterium]
MEIKSIDSAHQLVVTHELSVVRARRAHLRRSCQGLEAALAAPLADRDGAWATELAQALDRLRQALDAHIEITEGPDGLFEQVRADAPRLEPSLRRLHREHGDMRARLAAAAAELAATDDRDLGHLRQRLTASLTQLTRHRQRGADLLYQAYQLDLGGE